MSLTPEQLLRISAYYMKGAEIQRTQGDRSGALASMRTHIRRREQARRLAKQEKKP